MEWDEMRLEIEKALKSNTTKLIRDKWRDGSSCELLCWCFDYDVMDFLWRYHPKQTAIGQKHAPPPETVFCKLWSAFVWLEQFVTIEENRDTNWMSTEPNRIKTGGSKCWRWRFGREERIQSPNGEHAGDA